MPCMAAFLAMSGGKVRQLLESAHARLDKELQSARRLAPEKRRIPLKTLMEHRKACGDLLKMLEAKLSTGTW